MFVRTGAWIVWLYGAFGLVVVLAAYGAFAVYQHGVFGRHLSEPAAIPSGLDYSLRSAGQLETAYAPALQQRANERLAQLQATLESVSASLQEKNQLLNQRTAECQALQRDLQQTLGFIGVLVDPDMKGAVPSTVDESLPSAPIMRQLETEMASLRDDLAKGEFLEQEQTLELEQLRNLLLQAEIEIAQIQNLATTEFESLAAENETLTADREAISAAARQSLLRAGAAAVPGLIEQLADERPAVRQWSAATLGEIGSAAQEALPALTTLLADGDSKVREAAQQSLERITASVPR